ncbi:sialidase family protein [Aeoliella sp.]|uniref:sialidase family protein n=1 Tax=Aeoliella sp. TaxID=2795800 RepID=UPI003CCC3658
MIQFLCRAVSFGVLLTAILPSPKAGAEILTEQDVLVAGQEGYSVYRIPGFSVAADGSLLLFAEGRPGGADPGAPGDIDLVFKRSEDGGATWSNLSVLHAQSGFDYSDPRALVDNSSSTVHLQYVQWPTTCGQTCVPVGLGNNSSVIYYQSSTNNGLTWSGPMDINAQVKDPSWASLNTGPGLGIQLQWQDGAPDRNGRLLIPAHQRPPSYRGVAIYSDDGGTTWTRGTGVTPHYADESEVIELTNGDLLWDTRRGGSGRNRSISHDGGDTWVDAHEGDIPISAVDSALVRYSAQRSGDDRDRILFSGPLGSPAGAGNGRSNIGVWTSYDEGETFINPVQIQSGSAAYSVIDRLQDGTIGLIYEVGHNTIRYVNFDVAELEHGEYSAAMTHYDGFSNSIDRMRGGVGWSGSWQGNAEFTNVPQPEFNADSSVPFPGLGVTNLGGRVDFLAGQASEVSRSLVAQLALGQSQTTYLSLVLSGALDTTPDDSSDESFAVEFRDSSGTTQASFGVDDNEAFFVDGLGDRLTTATDAFERGGTYFLVAKIVSQHDGVNNPADQVFLKAFKSGVDAIPTDDVSLDWTLVGSDSENLSSIIESVALLGDSNATWSVDDLRLGTTFDAVTSMLGDGEIPNGLAGDVNQDGIVSGDGTGPADTDDVTALIEGWRVTTLGLPAVDKVKLGDLNLDGETNLPDVFILHTALEAQGGAFPFDALTIVPEPGTTLLTVQAIFLLWVCRSRRLPRNLRAAVNRVLHR